MAQAVNQVAMLHAPIDCQTPTTVWFCVNGSTEQYRTPSTVSCVPCCRVLVVNHQLLIASGQRIWMDNGDHHRDWHSLLALEHSGTLSGGGSIPVWFVTAKVAKLHIMSMDSTWDPCHPVSRVETAKYQLKVGMTQFEQINRSYEFIPCFSMSYIGFSIRHLCFWYYIVMTNFGLSMVTDLLVVPTSCTKLIGKQRGLLLFFHRNTFTEAFTNLWTTFKIE